MGKGKGNVDRWIFKVKSGITLCEIEISSILIGLKALKLAQFKIPLKTKIITN
jgi:large subunit ribosomal protein L16